MGEEGREVLVDHLKAPMLLAPAFLFANNNVVPVEVTALTDCVVWHINREAFFEFMQQEPTVLRSFLEVLSERGRFLSRKMRTFAVNSLRNRVIEYVEANGSITSVAAAAEQLGATRPSLSRVLSEMVSVQEVLNSKHSHILLNRTNPANAEVLDQDFGHIG